MVGCRLGCRRDIDCVRLIVLLEQSAHPSLQAFGKLDRTRLVRRPLVEEQAVQLCLEIVGKRLEVSREGVGAIHVVEQLGEVGCRSE